MKKIMITIFVGLLLFAGNSALAADSCSVAADVAKKGASIFPTDKKKGLQYFIKAQKLCPNDPAYQFNLGAAWMSYGKPASAIPCFRMAVKYNPSSAMFQNALAEALLQSGRSVDAFPFAQKAVDLEKNNPDYVETLCKAGMASGNLYRALTTGRTANKDFPDNITISKIYTRILDAYLANALKKVKSPKETEKGIALLKEVKDEPMGAKAYCLALASQGRTDLALREAKEAESRFNGNEQLKGLFDGIMNDKIQRLYKAYAKKKSEAVLAEAKTLAETYPDSGAKPAYDKLLGAYYDDGSDIPSAGPVAAKEPSSEKKSQTDDLMSNMWKPPSEKALDEASEKLMPTASTVDNDIPEGRRNRPNAVAVVIGNAHYSRSGKGLGDVDFAERDAISMKDYLVRTLGYDEKNIIFLTDATMGDLQTIFGTSDTDSKGQLYDRCSQNAEVFIYYSGHGAPGNEGKSAYLVPVDTRIDYIKNNGYSLDLLYKSIETLPTSSVTVVLDACFSGDSDKGMLVSGISPAMLKTADPIKQVKNCVIFTSTGKDQVSVWDYEARHGLFTYYFLKGIAGEADKNNDKIVTAAELRDYLNLKVPAQALKLKGRKQTPKMTGDGSKVVSELK